MGIILDIIVLAIIGICVFLGYKKGLIKVAFSLISFIAALILAFILFKPVSLLIVNATPIDDTIYNTIYDNLSSKELTIENAEELENQNVPTYIINNITGYIKEATVDTQNAIAKSISEELTNSIINGLSFIIVFLLSKVVLFFVKGLADAISKLPILNQFNKLGGTLYGIIKGILIIYIVLAIVSLVIPFTDNQGILDIINNSILTKFMYNHNLLISIFF